MKNIRASTIIWLTLCFVFLLVARFFFTTHIEWTPIAIYKDLAHIFWGCLITYALMRRSYQMYITLGNQKLEVTTWEPSWFLFWLAWGFAVFELIMAKFT